MIFLWKTGLLVVVLAASLYFDIRERKIKNFITIPAALAGAVANFAESGADGLALSLQGWFVPVLVLFALYYTNIMGAGDIKLFAAVGAIMGLGFVSYSFVFSVYCGGFIALCILIRKGELLIKIKCVFSYLRYILLTGRVTAYNARGDNGSKFIFSTAIVPGTLLQLVLVFLSLQGSRNF